ncbi:hypothetical protein DERF_011063 [Dermatophagoides farinae]|uniref:Uncharacterized protein n=1 Tax=Dermatophagoides farinae TaxID=6954 RepID=A0A922HS65_DERFA|nr:hypothetical protein DERF_011063 [Dermatophagoides farinae]
MNIDFSEESNSIYSCHSLLTLNIKGNSADDNGTFNCDDNEAAATAATAYGDVVHVSGFNAANAAAAVDDGGEFAATVVDVVVVDGGDKSGSPDVVDDIERNGLPVSVRNKCDNGFDLIVVAVVESFCGPIKCSIENDCFANDDVFDVFVIFDSISLLSICNDDDHHHGDEQMMSFNVSIFSSELCIAINVNDM